MTVKSSFAAALVCALLLVCFSNVFAARISDVRNTKHNFSSTDLPSILGGGDTRDVKADTESEICVFCHTPHGANVGAPGPLWNRELSGATYNTYNSGSLDATGEGIALDQPDGVSKLCLSCHDGTIAIGNVRNRAGSGGFQASAITTTGTGPSGEMAPGEGINTGFTRYLGTDLANDHPISLTFDSALADADGEMRYPDAESHLVVRQGGNGNTTDVPLEFDAGTATGGKVQCNSCHDPHIRSTDPAENIKFLRLNRLQKAEPTGTAFSKDNDIICLACHNKAGWVESAHANAQVANEMYTNAAAQVREFPLNTQVWETACLACHDTHTVEGSRRLLREGTDGPTIPSSSGYPIKQGGNAAIEEACYACHSATGGTLQGQGVGGFEVPDIKTDFTTMSRHMPITSSDQPAGFEVHDIGRVDNDFLEIGQRGKDFIESQAKLGKVSAGGSLNNRHVECTDCHNPHRVTKNRQFNDDPSNPSAAGTHAHTDTTIHTNLASGVLRGIWGVEPVYGPAEFGSEPIDFTIKRGNPGLGTSASMTYVTREYQVCLKCHSNYGYDTPPLLGSFAGGTPSGTNAMTQYTNQAMEYQSPTDHMGEGTSGTPSGAFSGVDGGGNNVNYGNNNHRSWHPVLRETGRTAFAGGGGVRNADANNWTPPFNNAVGTQTMYCTDCHGSDTANGTVVPNGGENGSPWGPHGSNNNFLLKGPWSGDRSTGTGEGQPDHLCFKCHKYDLYGTSSGGWGGGGWGGGGGGGTGTSGFQASGCFNCGGGDTSNLHPYHAAVVSNFRCNLCHIAVPHGWKNKVFLVNLNDVGPEAGLPPGTQVRNGGGGGGWGGGWGGGTGGYTQGPYYNRAVLKVDSFATSGNWTPGNCGSAGAPGNGVTGVSWMVGSSEACSSVP